MVTQSRYHKILRSTALVWGAVLLLQSGVLFPQTTAFSQSFINSVANVIGFTARVEPSELNIITSELTKQKQELDLRDAALREREIALSKAASPTEFPVTNYIMSAILFLLLVLITVNYVLDFIRTRRREFPHEQVV